MLETHEIAQTSIKADERGLHNLSIYVGSNLRVGGEASHELGMCKQTRRLQLNEVAHEWAVEQSLLRPSRLVGASCLLVFPGRSDVKRGPLKDHRPQDRKGSPRRVSAPVTSRGPTPRPNVARLMSRW